MNGAGFDLERFSMVWKMFEGYFLCSSNRMFEILCLFVGIRVIVIGRRFYS